MNKIITAMGNVTLNNELRKYAKYDVLMEDLICQDILISNLKKREIDTIIISGLLQGRWTLEEFVSKIRGENNVARIIVITDEIDVSTKKILEEFNVLDVFLDSGVEIQNVIDAIDREETVRKKYEMIAENIDDSYDVNENKIEIEPNVILEKAVQRQEVITIGGISGAGKSTIAANFCRVLAGKSGAKILLIDLDTLNGNIDEILKIDKVPDNIEIIMDSDKRSGINYASELIMKNRFDSNVFGELVVEANGFDVLTGNTSLHYCQNVLKEEYYEGILKCAKEKYDFIVLDTSSNIFLDSTKWAMQVANRILFVIENNYLSVKKMQQFINIVINIWGVLKSKIDIVVNKKLKSEVESEVISKITNGLKVIGEIKQNEELNVASYEKILSTINYIPKKSIIEKLSDIKKNLFASDKQEKEVACSVN